MAAGTKRLTSAIFQSGMISDYTVPPRGAPLWMRNCFLSRIGEITGKGYRTVSQMPTTNLAYWNGACNAAFHSDIGVMSMNGTSSATAANAGASASAATATVSAAAAYQCFTSQITNIVDHASMVSGKWDNQGVSAYIKADGTQSPFELSWQACTLPAEIVWAGYAGKLYKWAGAGSATASGASAASGIYWNSSTGNSTVISATAAGVFTNVSAGMYLMIDSTACKDTTSGEHLAFRVTKVVSSSALVVARPLNVTVASAARVAWRACAVAVVQSGGASAQAWSASNGTNAENRPRTIGVCCYHQGRLFVAGVADQAYNSLFNFNRIRWSGTDDPVHGQYTGIDYWDPGSYADVMPGVGGSIRGMVSIGNELIIIKSNAVIRMTGILIDGGQGTAQFEVLSNGVGGKGWQSWCMTKAGLIIAHETGLYLYDGATITNLCTNKVQKYWDAMYTAAKCSELIVTAAGNQVYVTGPRCSTHSNNDCPDSLVMNLDTGNFHSIEGRYLSQRKLLTVADASDKFCGHWAFNDYIASASSVSATRGYVQGAHLDLFDAYTTTNGNQSSGADYGAFQSTAALPEAVFSFGLARDELSEARIANVYLNGMHANQSLADGVMGTIVGFRYGLKGFSVGAQLPLNASQDVPGPNTLSLDSDSTVYYGMQVNNYIDPRDMVWRVPPPQDPGSTHASFARIYVGANTNFDMWRLYSIGLDIDEVDNLQSELVSGEY